MVFLDLVFGLAVGSLLTILNLGKVLVCPVVVVRVVVEVLECPIIVGVLECSIGKDVMLSCGELMVLVFGDFRAVGVAVEVDGLFLGFGEGSAILGVQVKLLGIVVELHSSSLSLDMTVQSSILLVVEMW